MKKRLAFSLLFLSGILMSPSIATRGIDAASNCEFQLPHTLDELLALHHHLNPFRNANLAQNSPDPAPSIYYITGVNRCTNQRETIKVDAIKSETHDDRITLEVTGSLQQVDGRTIQRQILITRPLWQ